MQGNAQSQGDGGGKGNALVAGQPTGGHHTHSHTLGQIVQRHGQHHHGAFAQRAGRTLRLVAAHMEVGNDAVEQQQKAKAQPNAHKGGQEGKLAHMLRLLHGGNDEAPHRGGNHHTGGKAGEDALQRAVHVSF